MKDKREKLPKGIRYHKSGKLLADVCVNKTRKTRIFATLEQAIIGREELKASLLRNNTTNNNYCEENIMSNTIIANVRKAENSNATTLVMFEDGARVLSAKQVQAMFGDGVEQNRQTPLTAKSSATSAKTHALTFPLTGQQVRSVIIEGEAWFVARDVCACLELSDTNKALLPLEEDEKCEHENYSGSGRKPLLVSESGLYTLIFRSNKPNAKAFSKWVRAEVLPAIRQHGGYMVPASPQESPEDIMARALIIAQHTITRQKEALLNTQDLLCDAQEQLEDTQTQLNDANPQMEAYDALLNANGTYTLTEAAKHFDLSGRRLATFLRDEKWLFTKSYNDKYKVNLPYQATLDKGYAVVKSRKVPEGYSYSQTYITSRGLIALERLLRQRCVI